MRLPAKVLRLPRSALVALRRFINARAGVPPWPENDPAINRPISFPPERTTSPSHPHAKVRRPPGSGGHQ